MEDHKRTSSDSLQALREWMAVVISAVILGLAAWTIAKTFLDAGDEHVYQREKDIMLYVVSLFGTVTGYYLGRVPAEVNARRAEKAASTAQQQLSESQEKLGKAAAVAATATEEKARVAKRLKQSAGELRNVSEAIGKVHATARPSVGAGMGIRADDDAAGGGGTAGGVAGLVEAKRRIDALLARMDEDDGVA